MRFHHSRFVWKFRYSGHLRKSFSCNKICCRKICRFTYRYKGIYIYIYVWLTLTDHFQFPNVVLFFSSCVQVALSQLKAAHYSSPMSLESTATATIYLTLRRSLATRRIGASGEYSQSLSCLPFGSSSSSSSPLFMSWTGLRTRPSRMSLLSFISKKRNRKMSESGEGTAPRSHLRMPSDQQLIALSLLISSISHFSSSIQFIV